MADIKNILHEIPNLSFDEVFSLQKQIDKEVATRSIGFDIVKKVAKVLNIAENEEEVVIKETMIL